MGEPQKYPDDFIPGQLEHAKVWLGNIEDDWEHHRIKMALHDAVLLMSCAAKLVELIEDKTNSTEARHETAVGD